MSAILKNFEQGGHKGSTIEFVDDTQRLQRQGQVLQPSISHVITRPLVDGNILIRNPLDLFVASK
jgi:hypothetical protein